VRSSLLVIPIVILILFFSGCVSDVRNTAVTVTSLDTGDIPHDTVGNFDVYTGRFLITNPANISAENIDVNIIISPIAAYCHGKTTTINIPRLYPNEKKTVLVSIAEFGDLDCQYNYTYQVFTRV
jgi:PBP1b-binding outer membrane lipoprotein LpoB